MFFQKASIDKVCCNSRAVIAAFCQWPPCFSLTVLKGRYMQNDLKLSPLIKTMPKGKRPAAAIYAICDSAGKELVRICRSKLHGTYIWRFIEGATYGPDCYNSASEAIEAFAKL